MASMEGTLDNSEDHPSNKMYLPMRMISKVVRGFGRGSSDLGIPTANLDCAQLKVQASPSAPAARGEEVSPHSTSTASDSSRIEMTLDDLPCGIYWGYCRIGNPLSTEPNDNHRDQENPLGRVYTAAISIGYNPTYGNESKTVEPHLIAPSSDPRRYASSSGETLLQDFYHQPIRLSVVGYLRPELPFEGLDKLVTAIKHDIAQAEALGDHLEDPVAAIERAWVESDQLF